jgi:hypothetical protein
MLFSSPFSVWGLFCILCPSNFTSLPWTDFNNESWKFVVVAGSRGCKAWTTVTLYGRSLSTLVANPAGDFCVPVCCARRPTNFCCVLLSSPHFVYFFFGKNTLLFSRFIVQKWHRASGFINNCTGACYAWNCVPRTFTMEIVSEFSSGTTFHIQFVQKITFSIYSITST